MFVQGAVQGHAVGLEEKVLHQRDDYYGQIFIYADRFSNLFNNRHKASVMVDPFSYEYLKGLTKNVSYRFVAS